MAEFSVNIGRLRNDSISFQKIAEELKIISGDIQSVRRNMTSGSGGFDRIRLSLSNIGENVLNEAAASATLEEALQKILDAYESTETRNLERNGKGVDSLNSSPNNESSSITRTVLDYGKTLSEFYLILFKYRNNDEKFREAVQDHYMSYTAQSLLDKEIFSEETWANASFEQRKHIIALMIAELNSLMGLNVSKISLVELSKHNSGKYQKEDSSIVINLNNVDPSKDDTGSHDTVMRTIIHEMRHAYQWAAINNPDQFNVSTETRRQWAYNYNHYVDGNKYGYKAYVEQPIEYDAKRFAGEFEDIKGYTPTYKGTW